ncbi:hypothetical protein FQN57_002285 [Myotisia sp. PD_48]|nr:hypothetical protein FQN57_002285 [Myotisia sp. PD_48]
MASLPALGRFVSQDISQGTLSVQIRPIPTPNFEADEHLVRVHATAFCAGELNWHIFVETPIQEYIPGPDIAGIVVAAPPSSSFKAGDEVFARIPYPRQGGSGDYTLATSSELAYKPRNLSWEEAATVPLSALTAWQTLFDQPGLFTGPEDENVRDKRLVVTAASGSVGIWIIQLARLAGFKQIVGTCGQENEEWVRSLGATDVLNYRKTSLSDWIREGQGEDRKADLVIDCFGGTSLTDAWGCVKDGGVLLSICAPPESARPAGCTAAGVKNFFFIMTPRGDQLQQVTKLLEQKKCVAFLDSIFEFQDYQQALDKVAGRHAKGKVVLKVA